MRTLCLLAIIALFTAPAAYAQNVDTRGLDLPVPQPRFGEQNDDRPPRHDPNGDDPNDAPPPTFYGEEIDSENDTIFYVLDVSGSMGWDTQSYVTLDGTAASGPRIDRAKAELAKSIMGLADNFKFNIIVFSCNTWTWSQTLQQANDTNKQAALAWLEPFKAIGGTGTGPATALALDERENQSVVLLTDGEPNCGASGIEGHRSMIRSANIQGAVINVFGISASGNYRAFCQSVASDSGGSYFDIP